MRHGKIQIRSRSSIGISGCRRKGGEGTILWAFLVIITLLFKQGSLQYEIVGEQYSTQLQTLPLSTRRVVSEKYGQTFTGLDFSPTLPVRTLFG